MSYEHIGQKIREVRQDLEWPQQKIAEALNVDYKTVSAWEVGRNNPPLSAVKKIAEMTGEPLEFFLDDEFEEADTVENRILKIEQEITKIRLKIQKMKQQR